MMEGQLRTGLTFKIRPVNELHGLMPLTSAMLIYLF